MQTKSVFPEFSFTAKMVTPEFPKSRRSTNRVTPELPKFPVLSKMAVPKLPRLSTLAKMAKSEHCGLSDLFKMFVPECSGLSVLAKMFCSGISQSLLLFQDGFYLSCLFTQTTMVSSSSLVPSLCPGPSLSFQLHFEVCFEFMRHCADQSVTGLKQCSRGRS